MTSLETALRRIHASLLDAKASFALARPQDLIDLRALLRVASADEMRRASDSLALITRRGIEVAI